MTKQIRLRSLLKQDEIYRQWFMKPAVITIFHSSAPWRLYVQAEESGPWARGDTRSYAKAYTGVKLRLPDAHDMAIHSKAQRFRPPVIKVAGRRMYSPMPEGHDWCELCRRPTVFKRFRKHAAIGFVDPEELRCTICGIRRESLTKYPRSAMSWPAK